MQALVGIPIVVLVAWSLARTALWHNGVEQGWGMLTLLGGVAAAYALDQVVDAPHATRRSIFFRSAAPFLLGSLAVLTGLIKVPAHLPLVILLAVMGGAYVPLKKFVPKGALTASAWAIAVVWLPASITPTAEQGRVTAICVFLIVLANALLCDALDVEADRSRGVRGLAPALGAGVAMRIAAALAAVGGLLSIAQGVWPLGAAAAPLALAAITHQTKAASGLHRRMLYDLLLIPPGLVVLALPPR